MKRWIIFTLIVCTAGILILAVTVIIETSRAIDKGIGRIEKETVQTDMVTYSEPDGNGGYKCTLRIKEISEYEYDIDNVGIKNLKKVRTKHFSAEINNADISYMKKSIPDSIEYTTKGEVVFLKDSVMTYAKDRSNLNNALRALQENYLKNVQLENLSPQSQRSNRNYRRDDLIQVYKNLGYEITVIDNNTLEISKMAPGKQNAILKKLIDIKSNQTKRSSITENGEETYVYQLDDNKIITKSIIVGKNNQFRSEITKIKDTVKE